MCRVSVMCRPTGRVVRSAAGSIVTSNEIRQWCADRISRWKIPKYVEFVDEFPMTPSGKIQKFILQKRMTKLLGLDQK